MIKILVIHSIFLLTSINCFSKIEIDKKPNHYLLFVHGLAGTGDTFGEMPNTLTKHLSQHDRSFQFRPYTFSYHTEDDTLNTYEFAFQLADFILEALPRLNKEDKISFITHSQGGVISSILIFNSFAGIEGHIAQYTQNIDSFITLGTPFWGSKLADIISHPTDPLEYLIKENRETLLPRAGLTQLKEMSLFSDTIRVFRNSLLDMDKEFMKRMFSQVKVLNIGGIANIEKLTRKYKATFQPSGLTSVLPFVFGGQFEYEADTAVSLPSSRLDSIYVNDIKFNYTENNITPADYSIETSFADFIPIYGIHASPTADRFLDIAFLPETMCTKTIVNCDHPSYEIIYNFMTGKSIKNHKNAIDKNTLAGFTLSFDIALDEQYKDLLEDIEVTMMETSRTSTYPHGHPIGVEIEINKSLEYRASSVYVDTDHDKKSFHYTGAFHYSNSDILSTNEITKNRILRIQKNIHKNGAYLTFKVELDGFKTRFVKVLVKPLKSSFINLNLEPRH